MRVLATMTRFGLAPADDHASKVFRRVKGDCLVEIISARNPRQHKLLFALLNAMVMHAEFPAVDGALIALKLATGHVKAVRMRGDEVMLIPDSVSYANMPQSKFEAWFDGAINTVCSKWLPGWKDEDLKRHVLEMLS